MIFQEQVPIIVNLTKVLFRTTQYLQAMGQPVICLQFDEDGKDKCAHYFPEKTGAYQNIGKMFINNKKVSWPLKGDDSDSFESV